MVEEPITAPITAHTGDDSRHLLHLVLQRTNVKCGSSLPIPIISASQTQLLNTIMDHSKFDPAFFSPVFRQMDDSLSLENLDLDTPSLKEDLSVIQQRVPGSAINVPVSIGSTKTSALLDTGAFRNYISEELVNSQTITRMKCHIERRPIRVEVANKNIVESSGTILLPIKIKKREFKIPLVILKTFSRPIILGLQFCKNNRVMIDTFKSTIEFGAPKETFLMLNEDFDIPAYSEVFLKCTPAKAVHRKSWVSGTSVLQSRFGLYAAYGKYNKKYPVVKLANLSAKNVLIPAGTKVAQVTRLDKEWVEQPNYAKAQLLTTTETQDHPTLMDVLPVDSISEEEMTGILDSIDIGVDTATPEQLIKVKDLVNEYKDLFVKSDAHLKQTHLVEHQVDTGNNRPISQPPYRTNLRNKLKVQEIIQSHLDKNFITPSKSPWASPIVLVNKRDGSVRFCIDYRKLNAATVRDVYPLPRIDDCLASLQGRLFFSTFDLCSGYNQIRMHGPDQCKSAFITDSGLYEWLVMPFGMSNSPATFQRLMDAVFAGLKWRNLLVYIDDIIVFSSNFDEHLLDLKEVFERMKKANLTFKASKCHILKAEVSYLGHIISKDGIRPDPDKIKAISAIPAPTNVELLRTFLGISGYYRKFVPNYSDICKPLYELTKSQTDFIWTQRHQQAFEQIKSILTSYPILAHPNYDYPFVIQTDASEHGLGAVLTQYIDGQEYVIMYISRVLQPCEKKWSIREKEALAILWAIQSFRSYVIGLRFKVETDHESLQWLLKATKPAWLVRWALELAEYDFEIVYRRGKANANADALSRMQYDDQLNSITTEFTKNYKLDTKEFLQAQREEPNMQDLIRDCEENRNVSSCTQYELYEGLLYKRKNDGNTLLLVPTTMIMKVLQSFHDNKVMAHLHSTRMYPLLCTRFFWPSMHADTVRFVKACVTCNKIKTTQQKQNGLLMPIVSTGPFEIMCVDIIGPIHTSEHGFKYILNCIDHYSSWAEAAPLRTLTAEETSRAFFDLIVGHHGCPKKVLSDKGTQFTSAIFKGMCDELGIEYLNSSSYHQQANGKIERFNRFVIQSLATITKKDQSNWPNMLQRCLFIYRISMNRTLDDTPFHLIYGRDAVLPQDLCFKSRPKPADFIDPPEYVAKLAKELAESYQKLNIHKTEYQKQYKEYYDRSHKEIVFGIGDLAMIYFPVPKVGLSFKLLAKYDGPYKVIGKLDRITYRVQSVANPKKIFVVHVQRMYGYTPYHQA